MSYTIHRASQPPRLDADFDSPDWSSSEAIDIANFHARSSDHHPRTRARLLCDDTGLCIHFCVDDCFVRAVATHHQDNVRRDSCVEAFLEPGPATGYFNFEFSCGGTMLLYHITGKQSEKDGYVEVSADWLDKISIHTAMPQRVDPEITEPTTWRLAAHLPFALFQHYAKSLTDPIVQPWRGNFYNCADGTSHPHWGTWQSVGEPLSFHKPEAFAPLTFAR
jgi:hypothetical protein